MLRLFNAEIKLIGNTIFINGGKNLISPRKIYIPGDISSAAFFMVAACITPDSEVIIKDVSLNPSRIGIVRVLKRMKAAIQVNPCSLRPESTEPMGDILVRSSNLKGALVAKEEVPSLIDELPVLMVAACFAKGKTIFSGVQELRVKETDRVHSMTKNLKKMGGLVEISSLAGRERIVIRGIKHLHGARVRSFGDHRTAMSMVIAGLAALGKTEIDDVSCINKSFPDFLKTLSDLAR
jgi:3-phosphoshikimate 1-carboxyvinyltransferase